MFRLTFTRLIRHLIEPTLSVIVVCSRRSPAASCDISFRSVVQNWNRYQRHFLLNAESTTADGSERTQPADSLSLAFLTVAPLPVVRRSLRGTRKAQAGGGDERKKDSRQRLNTGVQWKKLPQTKRREMHVRVRVRNLKTWYKVRE